MHASRILRRCLSSVFDAMHASRARCVLSAVDALVSGRRLTLTDVARSWVGATYVHAPLKALDRLLSNRLFHSALGSLHAGIAAQLLAGRPPVLVVDWSDLKRDGQWCLLRAAIPVGGRALTIYEEIHPSWAMNQPRVQKQFLRALARVLPAGTVPLLVTDAGFRSDWFRAVQAQGWHFVGRVRSNTHVRSATDPVWRPCASLHAQARVSARDLGPWDLTKGHPLRCRLVTVTRARRGRDQCTRRGLPQQGTTAKRARKSAREPWLLATSWVDATAAQVVARYAQRMQIETAFRDLKSHRYGMGFEDSLTRKSARLQVLLMLHTLASFAAWVMACAADACPHELRDPLARQARHRCRYSWHQRGRAWLLRPNLPEPLSRWIRRPRLIEALGPSEINT